MKSIFKHLRLIPAVMLVGAGLLVIKGVAIVEDARAQTAMTGQAPAPEPKDTTQIAVSDPAIDDSQANSAAEVDVLTSLSKRRAELDQRAQSLDMQANLIAAAEKRVDDKIASLKDLEAQMKNLLGQRDAAEQAQLTALVKTYSSMKPADAARIFNSLDEAVELNVAAQMKADVLGAIMAKMQPDSAQKLTVRLANRLKMPEPPPPTPTPAPPQQMAAIDPAATAPAAAPVTTPSASTPVTTAPATANPSAALSTAPAPTPPAQKQAAAIPAASKPQSAPVLDSKQASPAAPKPAKGG